MRGAFHFIHSLPNLEQREISGKDALSFIRKRFQKRCNDISDCSNCFSFFNNNNNLLIGCSITRVVYIEVLITRCILYNTIKICILSFLRAPYFLYNTTLFMNSDMNICRSSFSCWHWTRSTGHKLSKWWIKVPVNNVRQTQRPDKKELLPIEIDPVGNLPWHNHGTMEWVTQRSPEQAVKGVKQILAFSFILTSLHFHFCAFISVKTIYFLQFSSY